MRGISIFKGGNQEYREQSSGPCAQNSFHFGHFTEFVFNRNPNGLLMIKNLYAKSKEYEEQVSA